MPKYRCHKGRERPLNSDSIQQSAEWDVLVYQNRSDILQRIDKETDAAKREHLKYEYGGWKTTGLFVCKEQGVWRVGMGASDKAVWSFGRPLDLKWCYRVFYALKDQRFESKKDALGCIGLAGQNVADQLLEEARDVAVEL